MMFLIIKINLNINPNQIKVIEKLKNMYYINCPLFTFFLNPTIPIVINLFYIKNISIKLNLNLKLEYYNGIQYVDRCVKLLYVNYL